jgi:hypothetical protein
MICGEIDLQSALVLREELLCVIRRRCSPSVMLGFWPLLLAGGGAAPGSATRVDSINGDCHG